MADTVCIGAVCRKDGLAHAILCSDSQVELEEVAKGHTLSKAFIFNNCWVALLAGEVSGARELISRYTKHLNNPSTIIHHENVLDELRKPLREQNRVDIEDYISSDQGLTFEEFVHLSDEGRKNILDGVRQYPKPQLILVGMVSGFLRVFVVQYKVVERESFAAIGVGWTAAQMSLARRHYDGSQDLNEAVYYVYEAKKDSEIVPGVGEATYLQVVKLHPDGINVDGIAKVGLDILDKQYATFGRRPFRLSDCPETIPWAATAPMPIRGRQVP